MLVQNLTATHSRWTVQSRSCTTTRIRPQAVQHNAPTLLDMLPAQLRGESIRDCQVDIAKSTNGAVTFKAKRELKAGQVLVSIAEASALTAADAEKDDLIGDISKSCSELVSLALLIIAERAKGQSSPHAGFLQTLPVRTETPLLWSDEEISVLLAGSPVAAEARSRRKELLASWSALFEEQMAAAPARFPPEVFNEEAFLHAFSVVLGHAHYLPAADCFALLPVAAFLGRSGNGDGAELDFDITAGAAVLRATRNYRAGEEVLLHDPRTNGELLLATGTLPPVANAADCLIFNAGLLPADKLFIPKSQVLEQLGMRAKEEFPVFQDRMPIQLLSYLRLTRVADAALLAKVSFDSDVVLNQMNEYEVLQVLMGDCRERLAAYSNSLEEDIKDAQRNDISPRKRLAIQLCMGEKRILSSTMDAVRRRLAPIRGIPTKSGSMRNPNSDFMEMFDTLESLPTLPGKVFGGLFSWAKGDDDPEWGAKGNNKK